MYADVHLATILRIHLYINENAHLADLLTRLIKHRLTLKTHDQYHCLTTVFWIFNSLTAAWSPSFPPDLSWKYRVLFFPLTESPNCQSKPAIFQQKIIWSPNKNMLIINYTFTQTCTPKHTNTKKNTPHTYSIWHIHTYNNISRKFMPAIVANNYRQTLMH